MADQQRGAPEGLPNPVQRQRRRPPPPQGPNGQSSAQDQAKKEKRRNQRLTGPELMTLFRQDALLMTRDPNYQAKRFKETCERDALELVEACPVDATKTTVDEACKKAFTAYQYCVHSYYYPPAFLAMVKCMKVAQDENASVQEKCRTEVQNSWIATQLYGSELYEKFTSAVKRSQQPGAPGSKPPSIPNRAKREAKDKARNEAADREHEFYADTAAQRRREEQDFVDDSKPKPKKGGFFGMFGGGNKGEGDRS